MPPSRPTLEADGDDPPGAPSERKIAGWREWVALPDFNIKRIKAKLDTGARTSALHVSKITPFTKDGAPYVRFVVHPLQRSHTPSATCVALVVDHRRIMDSGGRAEERYVVRTTLTVGQTQWLVELSLTNRDQLGFRMLIGRQALRRRYMVDPARSFVTKLKRRKGAKSKKGRIKSISTVSKGG